MNNEAMNPTDDLDTAVLYRKRFRIPSTRLPGWNYADPARYFVTICTKWRTPWFGRIRNGTMRLSSIGQIVERHWISIPDHFPFITLDAFVVMPDHMHGIITIDARDDGGDVGDGRVGGGGRRGGVETCESHVSTIPYGNIMPNIIMIPRGGDTIPVVDTIPHGNTIPQIVMTPRGDIHPPRRIPRPSPGSLGSIIGQFKSVCVKRIRRLGNMDFAWQPRFHDRIIRDDYAAFCIRRYIRLNPSNWNA
jgi:hypothetical protein